MKCKATVSFAGQITMALNEVRDVPEDIAAPLIQCGYLIPEEETSNKENEVSNKVSNEVSNENEEDSPVESREEDQDAEAAEFVCPVCGKSYKTADGLDKHMKKHQEARKEQG